MASCRDCNSIDSFVTTPEGEEVCEGCGIVNSATMVITQEEMQQRGLPRRITLPSIQNSSFLQFLETHYQGVYFNKITKGLACTYFDVLQNTGFPNPMRNVVMAACIFVSAIDDNTRPYMSEELTRGIMTRDELLRETRAVINHLRANGFPELPGAIVKPSALVRRHCFKLGLPYREVYRINRAAQRAEELPLPYSNMADTYASALIVMGTEGRITVQQVSHLTGRGVQAINQMIQRLRPHQQQLFLG